MTTHKGRNCRVEIATTFGAAKTLTSISNALPAVIGSTGHGLANGTIGYISAVAGMEQLLGQAISVDDPATDDFDAEDVDTTSYGTFTSGSLIPVTAWATLSNIQSYDIGGGASEKLDVTTLIDITKQEETGLLAAQTVTLSGRSESQLAAIAAVRAAARNDGYVLVRITCSNGERRIFRGQPSLPGESLSVNQIATGGFDITVKGQVLFLPAA